MLKQTINEIMSKCNLCPRKCNVDRTKQCGFCGATNQIRVAKYQLHFYEEPCISGTNGSGTIFFSGCNLRCVYCQNYKISASQKGDIVSIEDLANIMLELQNQKAYNINLVTGFMYVPQIISAIEIARKKGLIIPIVYNTSGYEDVNTIKMLDGYVDIFLPDLKYYSYPDLSIRLSGKVDYFSVASKAIEQMYKQVGRNQFDENGLIKKGIIIRHLILPNHLQNTKRVLEYIRKTFGKEIYISIMAQYFPTHKAKDYNDINRKITKKEYDEVVQCVENLGFINGYIQDFSEENEEKYVPEF